MGIWVFSWDAHSVGSHWAHYRVPAEANAPLMGGVALDGVKYVTLMAGSRLSVAA